MDEIKRSYKLNKKITATVRINIGETLSMTVNVMGLEQWIKSSRNLVGNKRSVKTSGIYSLLKSMHFRIVICMFLDIFRMNVSRNNITVSHLLLILERMLLAY